MGFLHVDDYDGKTLSKSDSTEKPIILHHVDFGDIDQSELPCLPSEITVPYLLSI